MKNRKKVLKPIVFTVSATMLVLILTVFLVKIDVDSQKKQSIPVDDINMQPSFPNENIMIFNGKGNCYTYDEFESLILTPGGNE